MSLDDYSSDEEYLDDEDEDSRAEAPASDLDVPLDAPEPTATPEPESRTEEVLQAQNEGHAKVRQLKQAIGHSFVLPMCTRGRPAVLHYSTRRAPEIALLVYYLMYTAYAA